MSGPAEQGVAVAFDTGGTFTDIVIADAQRGTVLEKELSTPSDPAEAIMRGVARGLARVGRSLDEVQAIYGATTMVTNALIERKGARTALVTTRGFADIIEMRRENRYDVYDLGLELPVPYVPRELRFEVGGRLHDGRLTGDRPSEEDLAALVAQLEGAQVESIAVCLLHAYLDGGDEQAVRAAIAARLPALPVSLSSELAPEIREYERTSTTIINAYTEPIMVRHVEQLRDLLATEGFAGDFYFMLSSGRVRPAAVVAHLPALVVESGPAAGAMMAAEIATTSGFGDVLSLDMGGTTAKVCVLPDGTPRITRAFEVARTERFRRGSGHPLHLPTIELIEIGAGGGSIASVDGLERLRVGPVSAGSEPGPACYGRGGTEATVTDANLVLGYLGADQLLGGELALDVEAARGAVARVAQRVGMDLLETAWGIHVIANEHMARATRVHIAELGVDPRGYTMVALGGAGPAHACHVAQRVGVRRVVCPPAVGVGSAMGILCSPAGIDLVRSQPAVVDALDLDASCRLLEDLEQEGRDALVAMGVPASAMVVRRAVDMRYRGQGHEIEVAVPVPAATEAWRAQLADAYRQTYHDLFGRSFADLSIEILNWRVSVTSTTATRDVAPVLAGAPDRPPAAARSREAYFPQAGGLVAAAVYERDALVGGWTGQGPMIIEEREATTVVPPGATVRVDARANLVIDLPTAHEEATA